MEVRDLIDRCRENDPEAWAALWEVVSSAALHPTRRLLQRQGLGLELADDVMQEFYIYIREGDLHHLRAFRGNAMPQFRAYVRTLVVHFTLNTLRKLKRLQRLEDEAARAASLPDRTGPTVNQIRAAIQELTSLMSADDRDKVLNLFADQEQMSGQTLGESESSELLSRSARTQRRWRQALLRKYSRRVT